jgi:hypothetical protein
MTFVIILAADLGLAIAFILLVFGLFAIGKPKEGIRTWTEYFIDAVQGITILILAGRALRWW